MKNLLQMGYEAFKQSPTYGDYPITNALTKDIVSVSSFSGKNDNEKINAAIQSLGEDGGIVIFPYGSVYNIEGWVEGSHRDFPTGGIKLKNNVMLMLIGATLKIIPNNKEHYTCLNITNCENVRIVGGTLLGERYEHTNSPIFVETLPNGDVWEAGDQWGSGVVVINSRHVVVDGTVAKNFTGDGFCVGSGPKGISEMSHNVTFRQCVGKNNRRNNMSITGLYGGRVEGCLLEGANGVSPESGLDMEPNPGSVVSHVQVVNNMFVGNKQHGLLLASILPEVRSAMNCTISGNVAAYNTLSGFYGNQTDHNVITDNHSIENGLNGFAFIYSTFNTISNNHATKNGYFGFMFGDCDDNDISHNYGKGNSQSADGMYDQFNFFASKRNTMQGNVGRHLGMTKKARYGMYITADCKDNLAMNNDMAWSAHSAGFNNLSSSTTKGAGNRGSNWTSGSEVVAWGTGNFL